MAPRDSPDNPVGLEWRYRKLYLPRPTPFSQHLTLRFQVVWSPNGVLEPGYGIIYGPQFFDPTGPAVAMPYGSQGIYRVVQVPISYTFRHLHVLLSFLFGDGLQRSRLLFSINPAYDFTVQTDAILYSDAYRPGVITYGSPSVKLSSSIEPYHQALDVPIGEGLHIIDQGFFEREREYGRDWRCEHEVDFTLRQVWPQGWDMKRAIVFENDDITIHITISTHPFPVRRSSGNSPYVVRAHGIVPTYLLPCNDFDLLFAHGTLFDEVRGCSGVLEAGSQRQGDLRLGQCETRSTAAAPPISFLQIPLRYNASSLPSLQCPSLSSPTRSSSQQGPGRREQFPINPVPWNTDGAFGCFINDINNEAHLRHLYFRSTPINHQDLLVSAASEGASHTRRSRLSPIRPSSPSFVSQFPTATPLHPHVLGQVKVEETYRRMQQTVDSGLPRMDYYLNEQVAALPNNRKHARRVGR